jgi:hypothetical protein
VRFFRSGKIECGLWKRFSGTGFSLFAFALAALAKFKIKQAEVCSAGSR